MPLLLLMIIINPSLPKSAHKTARSTTSPSASWRRRRGRRRRRRDARRRGGGGETIAETPLPKPDPPRPDDAPRSCRPRAESIAPLPGRTSPSATATKARHQTRRPASPRPDRQGQGRPRRAPGGAAGVGRPEAGGAGLTDRRRRARQRRRARDRRLRRPDRHFRLSPTPTTPDHPGQDLGQLVPVARRSRRRAGRSRSPSISASTGTDRSPRSRSTNRAASSPSTCRPCGPSSAAPVPAPARRTTTSSISASSSSSSTPNEKTHIFSRPSSSSSPPGRPGPAARPAGRHHDHPRGHAGHHYRPAEVRRLRPRPRPMADEDPRGPRGRPQIQPHLLRSSRRATTATSGRSTPQRSTSRTGSRSTPASSSSATSPRRRSGDIVFEWKLYDVKSGQPIKGKSYQAKRTDLRFMVHKTADDITRDLRRQTRLHDQDRLRLQPGRQRRALPDGLRRREPDPPDVQRRPGLFARPVARRRDDRLHVLPEPDRRALHPRGLRGHAHRRSRLKGGNFSPGLVAGRQEAGLQSRRWTATRRSTWPTSRPTLPGSAGSSA